MHNHVDVYRIVSEDAGRRCGHAGSVVKQQVRIAILPTLCRL